MTVREAFELAYGPIPEGVTCHVGYSGDYDGISFGPTVLPKRRDPLAPLGGEWRRMWLMDDAAGPDISDRPAHAFLGFFGKEYDDVVTANKDADKYASGEKK